MMESNYIIGKRYYWSLLLIWEVSTSWERWAAIISIATGDSILEAG